MNCTRPLSVKSDLKQVYNFIFQNNLPTKTMGSEILTIKTFIYNLLRDMNVKEKQNRLNLNGLQSLLTHFNLYDFLKEFILNFNNIKGSQTRSAVKHHLRKKNTCKKMLIYIYIIIRKQILSFAYNQTIYHLPTFFIRMKTVYKSFFKLTIGLQDFLRTYHFHKHILLCSYKCKHFSSKYEFLVSTCNGRKLLQYSITSCRGDHYCRMTQLAAVATPQLLSC